MTVTVVIPTFNRQDQLLKCLQALAGQKGVTTSVEIVVVLDGCTDDTANALRSVATPFTLRVLAQSHRGPAAARDRGFRAASGDICLFLDDDIIPKPRLLATHAALHRERANIVGLGQLVMRIPPNSGPMLRWYADGWRAHYERFARGADPTWADCYSGNLSVRTDLLRAVGGFAPDMSLLEDAELGYRLALAGARFVYLAEAAAKQEEHRSSRELALRLECLGAGWITLYERHPSTLPDLLGTFHQARRREVYLRRLLLWFDLPVSMLEKVGYLLPTTSARRSWYSFLRRYCSWRGIRRAVPRALWSRLTSRTAILLYHAFARPGERASRFVITARRFALHLRVLRFLGCSILSLREYIDLLRTYQLPPRRTVVVTIDDGYADTMEIAVPILRRLGVPATLFIVTGKMGAANDWTADGPLKGRKLLSARTLKQLADEGLAIGSHTRTHPSFSGLSAADVRDEIASSRDDLQTLLGRHVDVLAYPYGDWNDGIVQLAAESGYLACCTAEGGLNQPGTPPHALRRLEVPGSDGLVRFLLKLSIGTAPSLRRWKRKPA
jgi:peptidoglycan/xylan/chitin deacetylase (PgdA/CDA1 family)/GT2 family glycosyltransferase